MAQFDEGHQQLAAAVRLISGCMTHNVSDVRVLVVWGMVLVMCGLWTMTGLAWCGVVRLPSSVAAGMLMLACSEDFAA